MTAPQVSTTAPAPTAGATGGRASLARRLVRRPLGLVSTLVLLVIGVVAGIGPWITPADPTEASLELILAPPGPGHPLGADSAGHDVLSRLLASTQTSIAAALLALVVALALGVTSGLVAAYYRGWFDATVSWITGLTMALPGMVVLLAARTVLGPSVWLAMLVFGVILAPAFYWPVHAAVSAVRQELYVEAALVSGLSDARIIGRHILSVVRAPIIIQAAIVMGIAIAVQSGLEFLGLGDSSVPTWGQMLNDGFINISKAPLLLVWPSLAIAVTCIALTLLANALRDELQSSGTEGSSAGAPATTVEPLATVTHPDESTDPTEPPTGRPLLRIRDLTVGYRQADGSTREVVHGVSLDLRAGEVHGLIGESGSGKSQTAGAVLGLLPRGGRITGGAIDFDGIALHEASERDYTALRGRRIAYVPQDPLSNLDPSFTIGSQLVTPLRVTLGLRRAEARERSLALLERVGIPDPQRTFDAYPFQISGGMAQRVLIAGAVSTEPDLVVADEPTSALDVTVQAEVLDLIRDLQREKGMAMLLVTHSFGVVADLCDRVTVMQQGRFIETGPARTILRTPSHPTTRALLDAVLDGGPARPAYTGVPS